MLTRGAYEKEIVAWIIMNISSSEKIWIAKVGLSSREFGAIECIIHLSGLILLVTIFFSNSIGRKMFSRLLQLVFYKNNDPHYWDS